MYPALRTCALALVALAVCASGASAVPKVRLEGKWRVSYKPRNVEGLETRYVWNIKPACGRGPCSVRVRSKQAGRAAERFRLRYDPAFGDYRGVAHYTADCVDDAGTVLFKGGYRTTVRWRLKPTAAQTHGMELLGTTAKGSHRTTYALTRKGRKADDCPAINKPRVDRLAMVAR
jgi:hypothetical protein